MITVQDVYDYLDTIAPFSTQLSFDNSGLLVGDGAMTVQRIAVCLDATPETVEAAADTQAQLMVTHHPVIFKPRKRLQPRDPAYMLVQSGMSVICTHTCFDCAVGGVNDVLAELFALRKAEAVPTASIPVPMVRIGFLPQACRPIELAAMASDLLGAKVRWCSGGKTVETLAVCGGSGGDLVEDIAQLGVDALLTGDADYHDFLDAEQLGVTLIAAGHYETENPSMPRLAAKLRERFAQADVVLIEQTRSVKHI